MTSIRLYGRSVVTFFFFSAAGAMAAPGGVRNALDETHLGLHDGAEFRLVDGACTDCQTVPQALWYFRGEVIAVPTTAAAGFTRGSTAQDDVREWVQSHPDGDGARPQFPASRAVGQAPVLSIDEYNDRVPKDKSQWKIVPVASRPFPAGMKDADASGDRSLPSLCAMYAYGSVVALSGIGIWRYRARRCGSRSSPAFI